MKHLKMSNQFGRITSWIILFLLILLLSACNSFYVNDKLDTDETSTGPKKIQSDSTQSDAPAKTITNAPPESEIEHTHVFGDWINIIEATCTENGIQERTCICGEKEQQPILSIGHIFVNHTCIQCGIHISSDLVYKSNYDGTCTVVGNDTHEDKDVVIPSVSPDGDKVTGISHSAFADHTEIKSITIPDSVTSIDGFAFSNCTNLTDINIPNSVMMIRGYAFDCCTSLTNIMIPDSVVNIGYKAFHKCTGLTSITIPDSVTILSGSVFSGCTSLVSITIPFVGESDKGWLSDTRLATMFDGGYLGYSVPQSLKSVNITGGKKIANVAFDGCAGLTSITIPDSVTSIGDSAFDGCTSLTSITIPDGVTSIGDWAFADCTGLTSITIPDSVTDMGVNPFNGCTNLTIYCEATSEPAGWYSSWNDSDLPVVWGYTE